MTKTIDPNIEAYRTWAPYMESLQIPTSVDERVRLELLGERWESCAVCALIPEFNAKQPFEFLTPPTHPQADSIDTLINRIESAGIAFSQAINRDDYPEARHIWQRLKEYRRKFLKLLY